MSSYASEPSSPPPSEFDDPSSPDWDSDHDADASLNATPNDDADTNQDADSSQDANSDSGSDLTPIESDEEKGPLPHRTPVKAAKARHPKDAAYNAEVVKEMTGRWVEVTTEQFWDDFLPGGNPTEAFDSRVLARWKGALSALQFPKGAETECYPSLCEAFNTVLRDVNRAADPLQFYRTWKHPQSGQDDLKPDLSLYSTLDKPYAKPKANSQEDEARVLWSHIEIPVEVKVDSRYAPFDFSGSDVPFKPKDTDDGVRSLAQMIKYVSEIQLHQHRTCVFLIWIQSDWLRLTRWDRTGAVVSKAFRYTTNPEALFTFLYRYAIADRGQRGHDPTVTLVAKDDADRAKLEEFTTSNGWEKWYLQNELRVNDDHYPLRKVTCPLVQEGDAAQDKSAMREGTYLIKKYRFGTHTPLGRGTKCFVAFDVARKRLVVIKDYWCADAPTIGSEMRMHTLLRGKNVRHISTVIAGGDVGGTMAQCSRNQVYMTELAEEEKPKRRFHDRLVFQEVGRPLETHVDQLELIRVVRDALTAHRDAYVRARVLHRDICPENILIDVHTGEGLLGDWELAKSLNHISGPASQPTRSGTWLTMSARLLSDPFARHKLSDDLESFVHTIGLMRLRFYFHHLSPGYARGKVDLSLNKDNTMLAQHLSHYYEIRCVNTPGQPPQGSGDKDGLFTTRRPFIMPPCAIRSLLAELYTLFGRFYDALIISSPFAELDDHETVLEIFERHTNASNDVLEKTGDQFEDLHEISGKHQTRDTGGGKRLFDPVIDLNLPPVGEGEPKKKKRRVAQSTREDA